MATDKLQNWREARRLRAFELDQKGWSGTAIAEALGVTAGAVSQWLKRAREDGKGALRHRKGSGRPPKLSEGDLQRLPELLTKGPASFGFRGAVWTRRRIGEVIRRTFGVKYSASHVGRLLNRIGWSAQKPDFRASQRDEAKIKRWVEEDWPRIKKKPSAKSER